MKVLGAGKITGRITWDHSVQLLGHELAPRGLARGLMRAVTREGAATTQVAPSLSRILLSLNNNLNRMLPR